MGPWLACTNELDGAHTRVRCWVNDELRQDAPTEDLIFDIPTLDFDHLGRHHALSRRHHRHRHARRASASVSTRPSSCAAASRVRIHIEGIGTLSNPVQ